MDSKPGLKNHCSVSFLSEGQKGNPTVREAGELSSTAMWEDVLWAKALVVFGRVYKMYCHLYA